MGDFKNVTYSDLQSAIDALVGRHGLEKAVTILHSFQDQTKLKTARPQKLKLLTDFIVAETTVEFNLDPQCFYESQMPEYREARMVCFHLLVEYTQCSYPRVGELFNVKKHTVYYFIHKCNDMLSLPQFFGEFTNRYRQIESRIIDLLTKLQ